jgi:hypothetical protein
MSIAKKEGTPDLELVYDPAATLPQFSAPLNCLHCLEVAISLQ